MAVFQDFIETSQGQLSALHYLLPIFFSATQAYNVPPS